MIVTSMAWRTPLGSTLDGVGQRLKAGDCAATTEHRLRSTGYRCRLGAPLSEEPKGFGNRKGLKRLGRSAVECAVEAFAPLARDGFDSTRVGLFFSYGGMRPDWDEIRPGLLGQSETSEQCWARGLAGLHPFWILRHLSNNAHAVTAEELKIHGEGVTFAGLNAGAQAIAGAIQALRVGAIDQALVVSHDSLLEPETVVALGEKGLLSEAASARETVVGFVPGEATAALLIERTPDPRRSALGRIAALDVADGEPLLPRVETLRRALKRFDRRAPLVDGASLGLPEWDRAEQVALREYLGADFRPLRTLGAMGQLGASSSLVQAIALIQALGAGAPDGVKSAIAVSAGFPGLLGLIHVEVG